MKGTIFNSGSIINSDDLTHESRTKEYATGQVLYDLLDAQTPYSKGIIKGSGLTTSHADDPLKAYVTNGNTIHIYSGVAYDGYEGKSNRIWVPDVPSDVPATDAAANTNYDNIDMPDETRSRDFSTADRPPRTNLKIFNASDADGEYHVCIRYTSGTYDPIVIPNDGTVEDSKSYDSYIIYVSAYNAAQLFAQPDPLGGHPWIQLATLSWDGAQLLITSDDTHNQYASCTVSTTDILVKQHQNLFHENCIISEDHTKLDCLIDNGLLRITFIDPVFTAEEGILINGEFVQSVSPLYVQFDSTMAAGLYYVYIGSNGIPYASTSITPANAGVILCSVYFSLGPPLQLQLSNLDDTIIVRDRRRFGSIGKYQLSSAILGESYSYLDDLKVKDLSDELISHRDNNHGNGLWLSSPATPYANGIGSLGATINGTNVSVNDIGNGDKLYIDGWECTGVHKSLDVNLAGSGAGDFIVYAYRTGLENDMHEVTLNFTGDTTVIDARYPICRATFSGAAVTAIVDLRVYGTVGYWHMQRNSNVNGLNNLPQPMVCMYGLTPIVTHGTYSDTIYLTDDWGTAVTGGGTVSGNRVYITKPLIMVYTLSAVGEYSTSSFGGYFTVNVTGYVISHITETSFNIYNMNASDDRQYYWIATGPGMENNVTSILKGKDNPRYYS